MTGLYLQPCGRKRLVRSPSSIAIIDATVNLFITYIGVASSDMEKMADRAVNMCETWKLSYLDGERISHKTNNFMARFTRKIKIYVFILTSGRRTGEILVEQTDGKKGPSDQSNPRCACAPRVNNLM